MRGKITKRSVDALALSGIAETVLWDTEVKGFGCRLQRGGAKSYILHYRGGVGRGTRRKRPLHDLDRLRRCSSGNEFTSRYGISANTTARQAASAQRYQSSSTRFRWPSPDE